MSENNLNQALEMFSISEEKAKAQKEDTELIKNLEKLTKKSFDTRALKRILNVKAYVENGMSVKRAVERFGTKAMKEEMGLVQKEN